MQREHGSLAGLAADADLAAEIANSGDTKMEDVSYIPVNDLAEKKLITKQSDENDARIIHLKLTTKATPLITKLQKARNAFLKQFFTGFTASEIDSYKDLTSRIINNFKQVNYESK